MKKLTPIRDEWITFAEMTLHPNATVDMIQDMQMAFYGGFFAAVGIVVSKRDDAKKTQEKVMAALAEFNEFCDQISKKAQKEQ